VGNADGRSSPELIGVHAALPLAGKIHRSISRTELVKLKAVDVQLVDVEICARSGLPCSQWCPAVKSTRFSSDQFLNRKCDIHFREKSVNGQNYIEERFPSVARGWDLSSVIKDTGPPVVKPASVKSIKEFKILSPAHRSEFVLTGLPDSDCILLRTSSLESTSLSWYIDGRSLGRSSSQEPLWLNLTPGRHVLSCMTSSGQIARVEFRVWQEKTSSNI
jgi:membrane carboxypeptidase/penicillin-binding protein PbpC